MSVTGPDLPPIALTPSSRRVHEDINGIVSDLNHALSLDLPLRDKQWSPHKASKTPQENCVDGIKYLRHTAPGKLKELLREFKEDASPIPREARVAHLQRKLQETIGPQSRSSSERRRNEREKTPIRGPDFNRSDTPQISEETNTDMMDVESESEDEDEFETPPQSPTQRAADAANQRRERQEERDKQMQIGGGSFSVPRSFRKRPSEDDGAVSLTSPQPKKTSSDRRSSASTNRTDYFSAPSVVEEEFHDAPIASQSSIETAVTNSFTSTIPATTRSGIITAETSFDSNVGPIPSYSLARADSESNEYSSFSSGLRDYLEQMMRNHDFKPGANLSSSDSISWDSATKEEALNLARKYDRAAPQAAPEPMDGLRLHPPLIRENQQLQSEQRSIPAVEQVSEYYGVCGEHYQVRGLPSQQVLAEESPERSNLSKLPFRVRWEAARISIANGFPVNELAPDPTETVQDYEAMWLYFTHPSRTRRIKLPRKGSSKAWAAATGAFEGLVFSGKLSFNSKPTGALFTVSLNPMELDKSSRFERAFGGDRFLTLTTPHSSLLPEHLKGQQYHIRRRLIEWLLLEKEFLGRKWRAIHIEPYKNQNNKRSEREYDLKIIFFATEGYDILPRVSPISSSFVHYSSKPQRSVDELLEWFMPLKKNAHRSYCKMFSRIRLGFSRTTPTIVFCPDQVRWVRDVLADSTPEDTVFDDRNLNWTEYGQSSEPRVMNDGCARISLGACRLIWERLGASGPIPSAFQARINGAKGVWIRSAPTDSITPEDNDIWIEINDSQKKFDPHDEDISQQYDSHRWTFEVVQFSHKLSSTALHLAFVPILHDRGVKLEDMQRLVIQELDDENHDLLLAVTNPLYMRSWINERFANSEERRRTDGLRWQASLPKTLAEKIVLCLEAGFEPMKLPYLANAIERIAQLYFSRVMQSLAVRVGRSAMALGIADPKGVLMPGQVHFAFSENFVHDASGDSLPFLNGTEVLVARHPALRASDIQKVKTVYRPELSHLVDVVVFPSRGCIPLASKLQGGDYDGDVFWVCWDPALVKDFKNAPAPLKIPKAETYGIEVDGRTLHDIVAVGDRSPVDNFLAHSFSFACNPSLLGVATNFHESLAYFMNSINDPGVNLVADLHSYLIDASKNGYNFNQASWHRFLWENRAIRYKQPEKPAYKVAMERGFEQSNSNRRSPVKNIPERPKFKDDNITDVLFSKVIEPHLLQTIQELKEVLSAESKSWDVELQDPYMSENNSGDDSVRSELQHLKRRLAPIHQHWVQNVRGEKPDKDFNADAYNDTLEECFRMFTELQPQNLEHALIAFWVRSRLGQGPTYWSLIKASALFTLFHERHAFTFHLAGRELAYIKAHHQEGSRMLVEPLWAQYKPRKIHIQVDETIPPPQSDAVNVLFLRSMAEAAGYLPCEDGSTMETETEDQDQDDFYSILDDMGTYEME